jgi:hypothetical protein
MRGAGAVYCARHLERFWAHCKAIAAANSAEDDAETQNKEELSSLPGPGVTSHEQSPSAKDITGPARSLSLPVKKAQKLLMVSAISIKDSAQVLTYS